MLKKIYFVYTLIIAIMVVWLILNVTLGFTNLAIFNSGVPQSFFINNILAILTMTLCSIKLQKKNENYVIRILPFFILLGMFATLISYDLIDIKGFSIKGTIIETVLSVISDFMNSSYSYLLPLAVLMNLEENNSVTKILKRIGYVAVVVTLAVNIFVMIKTEMVATLPNLYSSSKLGLRSLAETKQDTYTILIVTMIIECAVVILGYLTNYCLETETIRSEDLNYEELVDQAKAVAKAKEKQAFNQEHAMLGGKAILNTSQEEGALNLSNQLSAKSNVGVVDKSNTKLKVQNIDKNLIKVGPVENKSVELKEPVVEQPTTPPPAQPQQQVQQAPVQQQVVQQPAEQPVQAQPQPQPQPQQVQQPVQAQPQAAPAQQAPVQQQVIIQQPVQNNGQ